MNTVVGMGHVTVMSAYKTLGNSASETKLASIVKGGVLVAKEVDFRLSNNT